MAEFYSALRGWRGIQTHEGLEYVKMILEKVEGGTVMWPPELIHVAAEHADHIEILM